MPALTVLITVATLLVGGRALFIDVLRVGLSVVVAAAVLGAAARAFEGPLAAVPVRRAGPRGAVTGAWGPGPGA